MKVVSQKTRNDYVKELMPKKYEDYINICTYVKIIRNCDTMYDYYV